MSRVALVTGANQGLGFALVDRLLEVLHREDRVYLTARSVERGMQATLPDGTDAPHRELVQKRRILPFTAR